jgi:hypothetical protein
LIAETLEYVRQLGGAQPETTETPIFPIEEIKSLEKPSEFEPPKFERLSSPGEMSARKLQTDWLPLRPRS